MALTQKFLPFIRHSLVLIPQMSPMNWFLLYIYFTALVISASVKLHFFSPTYE